MRYFILLFALITFPFLSNAQELQGIDRLNALHTRKHPSPTPVISFSPSSPQLLDNAPIGTLIAQVVVTMSDGSQFTGSLGFALPYNSDSGLCVISGRNLVLGRSPPVGTSIQNCTITTTQ